MTRRSTWGLWPLLALPLAAAAQPDAGEFRSCLAELRREAANRGVTPKTFERAMDGVMPDAKVLELMDRQPEFVTPIWDYLAALVDERRVADGRRQLERWAPELEKIEREYGVDRHVLVALWGVETRFGERLGSRPLLRSLATTSCFGRRQRFFREELFATLRIVQDGDIPAEQLAGSWAGAFGHTQFMPTTFRRVAVDFDNDGRRDILGSVPDALASSANYLKQAGWLPGELWGYEARVPEGYDGPSGRRTRKPLAEWRALGIRQVDGSPLPGEGMAALFLPAGARGPAFVVLQNFQALLAYNPAEAYALAIGHLADRLAGGGAIRAAWPIGEKPLNQEQRVALQERLAARGFDVGEPDGIIGPRTVEAIKAFQRAAGLPPDGFPTTALLRQLEAPR